MDYFVVKCSKILGKFPCWTGDIQVFDPEGSKTPKCKACIKFVTDDHTNRFTDEQTDRLITVGCPPLVVAGSKSYKNK